MLTRRALLAAAGSAPLVAWPGRVLRRGINITNWFRFQHSRSATALAAYLSDAALATVAAAGFDFVRLAVEPVMVAETPAALLAAIRRLQAAGLAVIVDLHPIDWTVELTPLAATWQALARLLVGTAPALTYLEVVNEPVFAGHPAEWAALQDGVIRLIRSVLPHHTVIATGADWGSIDGLLAAPPPADPNTVMSFHFYEPSALTTLGAAWRPDLAPALARLPFPADAGCAASEPVGKTYCDERWDAARVARRIGQASAWSRAHGVRVVAGEFGASARLNAPARLAWLAATRRSCEAAGIGWALWGLEDEHGFDLPRPPPRAPVLDRAVLAALGLRTS